MIRARKCNIQCYKYESGQDDRGLPDINVSRFGEARKEMEQKPNRVTDGTSANCKPGVRCPAIRIPSNALRTSRFSQYVSRTWLHAYNIYLINSPDITTKFKSAIKVIHISPGHIGSSRKQRNWERLGMPSLFRQMTRQDRRNLK